MVTSLMAADRPYGKPSNTDFLPFSYAAPPSYPYTLSRTERAVYEYSGGEYELATTGDSITVRFTGFVGAENVLDQFLPLAMSFPAASLDSGRWLLMIAPGGCITEISGFNALYAKAFEFPLTTVGGGQGSESITLTFPPGFTDSQLADIWNFKFTWTDAMNSTLEIWKDGEEGSKTTNALVFSNVSGSGNPKIVVGNMEGAYGPSLYSSITRAVLLGVTFSVA